MKPQTILTPEAVFGKFELGWGNKFPRDSLLIDIWKKDREYLLWATNLQSGKTCQYPPPPLQQALIQIAYRLSIGETEQAQKLYEEFHQWNLISQLGEGLNSLPRPSPSEAMEIIAACTLLGGHSDLDGIYSLAIAMLSGNALSKYSPGQKFSRIRLFHYFRKLDDYNSALQATKNDSIVVIDFSAHPKAALNLDHHTTSLSFWEFGTPLPTGIYDPEMPSCPRLLSTYCGLKVKEDILTGCDMVDGARYSNLAQTTDLSNPFVALEYSLNLDVSEQVAKKVVITLAENNLDPYSVLSQKVWKARVELLTHELEEQRAYWSKGNRITELHDYSGLADARLAPYSAARFRYLPFENETAMSKAFLVTIRPSGYSKLNLGIARNPFFTDPSFFNTHDFNLGIFAKSLGAGGGRKEAAAVSINPGELDQCLAKITLWFSESQNSKNGSGDK